jgi:Protein of unknown function (DUF2849)
MQSVISANRLSDGIVVFYKSPSVWVEFIDDARVLNSQTEVDEALHHAAADVRANAIVDPYAFDVSVKNGAITPTHLRELIRARGPTVHLDHGKQAQPNGHHADV